MKIHKLTQYAALIFSGLAALTVSAQTTYTWTGATDNVWDTTTANWNSGNGLWVNSAIGAPIRAQFNAGQAGTVNIAAGGVSAQYVAVSGNYTFTGGPLYITMDDSDPNGKSDTMLDIAGGLNVTFDSAIVYSGSSKPSSTHKFNLGAGSVLTLNGGMAFNRVTPNGDFQWNITAANATLNLDAGTYSGISTLQANSGTINQNAATVSAGSLTVGGGGNTIYTLNDATAMLKTTGNINITGAGNAATRRISTLNILAGSATTRWQVYIGNGAYSDATLNVAGGSLRMYETNNDSNAMFLLNRDGGANEQTALFSLSGGVVATSYIGFGGKNATVASSTNSTATLRVTGGALYLGQSMANGEGLKIGNMDDPSKAKIELGGGTLGAIQNWTSSMNMKLTGSGGNINFRAADEGATARDITLSGVLSGTGGLVKSGGGTLLLSGANTYTGDTVVTAGVLTVNGNLAFALNDSGEFNKLYGTAGTVNLNGTITIDVSNVSVADQWTLIDKTGLALTYGGGFDVSGWTTSDNIEWTYNSGDFIFNKNSGLLISNIPEPSTWALLLTGAALLAVLRKRR